MPKFERLKRVFADDFVRSGAMVFGATVGSNAFNYVFHFVVSRALGPAGYGAVTSLISLVALASIPASVLSMVIVRFAAQFHALGESGKLAALYARVVQAGFVLFPAVLLAAVLLRDALSSYLRLGDPVLAVLCGVILAAALLNTIARSIVQGVQDFRRYVVSLMVETAGKALFGIVLVELGFGVRGATTGYLIAVVASLAYTFSAVRAHTSAAREPLHMDLRRLLQTAGAIGLGSAATTVLTNVDVVLVKHYYDPHTAGLYGVLSLTGKVVLFVLGTLPTVLLPKASAHASRGESPLHFLYRAFAAAGAISAVALAVTLLVPGLAIRALAGGAFTSVAPLLAEYTLAMVFLGAATIVAAFKIALHRFDFVAGLWAAIVLEIGLVAVFHDSLASAVHAVLAASSFAFVQSLWRVNRAGRVVPLRSVAEAA